MKKTLLFALLIATMLLPACGPAQPAAPLTEVIWYVTPDEREQQWQAGVISDFEAKFPEIVIRLEVASSEAFDTRMQVMTAAGTPPDVFIPAGNSGFMDYVARDLAADLTPFIERDSFDLTDFEPTALASMTVDGKTYGLPAQISGSYLFYNKDLFDQAGVAYPTANWDDTSWTYEAFLEKCMALTSVQTGVYGCSLDLHPVEAYPWLWGQDMYPAEAYQSGFANTAFLDQPAVAEAFQTRQDIVWKMRYMPDLTEADVDAVTDAVAAALNFQLFASQKVAMWLTGNPEWNDLRSVQDFRWGVAALPYTNEGRRDALFTRPWMLYAKSQHPEEAWTFLRYLSEAPQQASWMISSGTPPARMSLLENWYGLFSPITPAEVQQAHLGALAYGRESPQNRLVRFDLLNRIVLDAVEPVFNNEKDALDTLPEAHPRLLEALKQIRAEYQKTPTPTPAPSATETPESIGTTTTTPTGSVTEKASQTAIETATETVVPTYSVTPYP